MQGSLGYNLLNGSARQYISFNFIKTNILHYEPATYCRRSSYFYGRISFLIEHTTDLRVAGVLHKGNDVIPFLAKRPIDIMLLDIDLPDLSGFEVAKRVRQAYPDIRILVLSMLDDISSIERMYRLGVQGFCIKSEGRNEVFKGLERLRKGTSYWPKSFQKQHQGQLEKRSENALTERELQIMGLICNGTTTTSIAEKLFLSTRTVETHRKNIYKKLNVHTNVELASHARKYLILT